MYVILIGNNISSDTIYTAQRYLWNVDRKKSFFNYKINYKEIWLESPAV